MKSHESWFVSNILNTFVLTFALILQTLLTNVLNAIFFGGTDAE